jgi:hypothetical protein
MIILLSILNLLDYILTLLNLNNFEEANPIANLIISNVWLLSILKLIIVPLCIYVLYKYRYTLLSKIGTIALSGVYLYAVVLGVLYLIVNVKRGVL